ncbi:putative helix-turn-helix HTH_28 domain containing protein 1 [Homarus americanus]|uniref:Putative helix-turn-helix HTH_28 domain containing protein 1 n=1 Tax=Homarus americanus TaxID=6706 RepID=A0A8J5TIC4_HOMAM|nr:putative helix-turn-helix HTH_28 domain containing protein 1 [Homarus americanus]
MVMEVQPQRHVRPPQTRANRPEVITSRGRIIGYHEAGKGIREISRLLSISRDTVRLWVRRYEEEGHVLTRPRPGRPRDTTPAADQQIQRAAERAPLSTAVLMEVQPQRHVRPPQTRANRPEVITSRGRIIGYHEAGKGIREISRLLSISRDTVRLWVRRYEEEGHVLTRPRPGRPRDTTPAADQQIQRAAERAPLSTALCLALQDRLEKVEKEVQSLKGENLALKLVLEEKKTFASVVKDGEVEVDSWKVVAASATKCTLKRHSAVDLNNRFSTLSDECEEGTSNTTSATPSVSVERGSSAVPPIPIIPPPPTSNLELSLTVLPLHLAAQRISLSVSSVNSQHFRAIGRLPPHCYIKLVPLWRALDDTASEYSGLASGPFSWPQREQEYSQNTLVSKKFSRQLWND